MSEETNFPAGIYFDRPRENSPEWVKGRISLKKDQLTEYMAQHANEAGYVNLDLLKSKEGKLYLKLNDWQPEQKEDVETPW